MLQICTKCGTRDCSRDWITPPSQLFEEIVNPNFWPEGTLIREFKPRKRATIIKPTILPSEPKN